MAGEVERFLEAERAQLPLWAVVGLMCGITAWFSLGSPYQWAAFAALTASLTILGFTFVTGRTGRALGWFALAALVGCLLVWVRATWIAAPRLERPKIVQFQAKVENAEILTAREIVRLTVRPTSAKLPPVVRISVPQKDLPTGIAAGAQISVRARLAPPPPMALPGTYDFARDAWFKGIGAVGKTMGPIAVERPAAPEGLAATRESLRRHIAARLPGSEAGIAIALVTGDQNGVSKEDADAMRRSGLTHLLSVSGLHIAAVVGFAMLLTLRLLALSETLALRFNLVLVAAAAAAAAGIGYTVLTGMQVPTVRSCVAALLILAGIALGRDALSMRLVAAGALIVLLFRPEALAGPSFQVSFAAVTAIVAIHSTAWSRRLFRRREESFVMRLLRAGGAMIVTGLAVEIALIPLALFHFHRSGLYGVGANIIAIPLTTFVIMPLEGSALLLDLVGLGAPFWWLTGHAIGLLLDLARSVSAAKGAVAMLPSMPQWTFVLMVLGGLWLALWTTRVRRWGLVPIAIGALGAAATPTPDLLVTGDGRHLAVIAADGTPLILRDRAGDYVRSLLSEAAGFDGDALALDEQPIGRCSRDSCIVTLRRHGRQWRVLATRTRDRIDWRTLTRACAAADIAVSERWLPRGCTPRWLKLDRGSLGRWGGVTIRLGDQPSVETVAERVGQHPWRE
jgi:competence protein ComEC